MTAEYILLAEDNPADIALTRRVFEKCGIRQQLKVARDGQEALDHIFGGDNPASKEARQNPALILLDLNLPYLSGLEVLRQIRANKETCAVAVVVMTSSDDPKDRMESLSLGANRFLSKPVRYEEFKNLILELIGVCGVSPGYFEFG